MGNSGDKPLTGGWEEDMDNLNNRRTHPVGQKKGNELGLHDMTGNVDEWCADWAPYFDIQGIEPYTTESQINPTGPTFGSSRVHRGGSWASSAESCRVSCRGYYYGEPVTRKAYIGFRVASSVDQQWG